MSIFCKDENIINLETSSPENIEKIYKKNRIELMIAMTIGYGFYYVCRLGLSVVKKPLIDDGIFTATQLGNIGAGIFYGYAFGKFFNGFIADHVNVKKFFIFGLILSIICNVFMGLTSVLWIAILVWTLNGWFQSFGAVCCGKSISTWFPRESRGKCFGIWSASHPIGEGLTFVGTAALVSFFGWRSGFLGAAASSVLICIAICFLMKPDPVSMGLPSVAELKKDDDVEVKKKPDGSVLSSQLKLFTIPTIWICSLACGFLYVGRYAINNWGILFLQEIKGFSLTEAGTLLGVNTMASIVGGIVYGFVSDEVFKGRRPPATFVFGLIEISALILVFASPITNYWLLMLGMGLFGFSIGGLMIGIALLAVDVAPKAAVAATFGFTGIFSYLGAALQENISGYLIDKNSHMVDGVLTYDFTQSVTFWIVSASLSVILAVSLWNVKTHD